MKKYRKVKKTDKFPDLPKGIKPVYILKENFYTYIFAAGKEKNYTFTWNRVDEYYQEIQECPREKNKNNLNQREYKD